jgi:2-C-methyl-D-erythritol 2,4-cyclodiphosphate synthase
MAEPITRTGWGFDAHRFGGDGHIVLCGVEMDDDRGIEATSDGDVAVHALIDALLGAVGIGDLGVHFPSEDPEMAGADSMKLLVRATQLVAAAGYDVGNVDVTVVSQSVRVAPHRAAMRTALAVALGIEEAAVSVKATTTDGMGAIGNDEGIAAAAVAVVYRSA